MKTAAAVSGAALAASAGFMAYAVRSRSSTVFGPSVYQGTGERRSIALTFDDGPSESTPALLEVLAKYQAPATFFQCGANVRRLPAIAREVASAGHEIGNHSDSHPLFAFKSAAFMADELSRAQESIAKATSARPRLFRAPFGARWFGLGSAQKQLGLLGVMWTVIGVDWKRPADRVVTRLLHGAHNGAIFCLHDGRELQVRPDIGVTLRAVEQILPVIIDTGYHFERVSDIICSKI
ncbi:MAG TPA: polysaccharide deacetylase family protein [Bryobacteraceae bacterium]|nr:polysaccharide deacetylase family protein [Bryobacteraceae bacterium]